VSAACDGDVGDDGEVEDLLGYGDVLWVMLLVRRYTDASTSQRATA
jgi:hypothetical protein